MDVTEEQLVLIGDLLERRLKGEPLQYILGEWEFMGLPFYVDERALIPRQDTELLLRKSAGDHPNPTQQKRTRSLHGQRVPCGFH
jgi:release factor glutamine methyltransferase